MGLEIARYTASCIENVRQFNRRMALGGRGQFQLPNDLRQFEESEGGPLPWEGWLAVHEGIVRGGYLLRWQDFSFRGEIRKLAFYCVSVSEGAIDPAYAAASVRMIASATSKAPLSFALGMGGVDATLPKILQALGWQLRALPFLFRAVNPGQVVRSLPAIRRTPLRRAAFDAAAFTGAAWAGLSAVHAFRRKVGKHAGMRHELTPQFDAWADSIWQACGASFAMIAVRDQRALNVLYPGTMPRISRLKVCSGASVVGWAVVLNTEMKNDKHFGNLHVGTLVDCLASAEHAPLVAEAAESFLENQGVDLIISNQSHHLWRSALLDRGYLEGPSNFALATSKGVTRLLDPFDQNLSQVHLTRGDGDGPIHL